MEVLTDCPNHPGPYTPRGLALACVSGAVRAGTSVWLRSGRGRRVLLAELVDVDAATTIHSSDEVEVDELVETHPAHDVEAYGARAAAAAAAAAMAYESCGAAWQTTCATPRSSAWTPTARSRPWTRSSATSTGTALATW
eukprot:COSAG01_NODE_31642_length_594_cov_0.632323_1_plen_139_part_10